MTDQNLGHNLKLLIVQPYLTEYRLNVFIEIAEKWDVTLVSSQPQLESGYGAPDIRKSNIVEHVKVPEFMLFGGFLIWQSNLARTLLRVRPDKILCAANPRNLSFWIILLLSKLLRIEFYCHGQGLYSSSHPSCIKKCIYGVMVNLATKYICYTDTVANSLYKIARTSKLAVAHNSVNISHEVVPYEKTGNELGILFIGRLRPSNNLSLLISVVQQFRLLHPELDCCLHVVGGGSEKTDLMNRYMSLHWIVWHGMIFDQKKIKEISRLCSIGCYPGNAGLSVVHYMALSLVTIVHDRLDRHMGPEPSYVSDGVNGFVFDYADPEVSLLKVLQRAFATDKKVIMQAAWNTYRDLVNPPLSSRLMSAMSGSNGQ